MLNKIDLNLVAQDIEVIDFHSHILPGIDHGSRDLDNSIAQLKLMANVGVQTVCATSHFYPHVILASDFIERRNNAFDSLRSAVPDMPRPKVILGAEVLICEYLSDMEGLRELCFEGTNILLLEMPLTLKTWSQSLYDTIEGIASLGICPVFAHVDRYPQNLVEPLLNMGYLGQVNASSMTGLFCAKHLSRWVNEGRIVAFGSDLHGASYEAYAPFVKLRYKHLEMFLSVMKRTQELLSSAIKR